MSLNQVINAVLSKLNLVLMRRSTLIRTLTELETLKNGSTATITALTVSDVPAPVADTTRLQLHDLRRELLRRQVAAKWEVVDYVHRSLTHEATIRCCPLCHHESPEDEFVKFDTQCQFGGGHLRRRQCPNCDVIFGADKMFELSGPELSQDYEWHYGIYEEGDSTEQELRAFHSLHPSRDGVYLNYGAGAWSRSVEVLRNDGWNVFAFEPHGSASAKTSALISSRETLDTMRFDGLFSNNVLEHFREPANELAYMRTLLKPGAKMAHATPCFEYRFEYTRFHLFFFLGRSRALLASQIGMSIKEYVTDGDFMCCLMESTS
jgi:hypothetical protein